MADGKVHLAINVPGHYVVESSRIDAGFHIVNGECVCADAQQRGELHRGWCKHRLAVEVFTESQAQAEAPATEHPTDEEIDGMAAYYQDSRPLEEQVRDLF